MVFTWFSLLLWLWVLCACDIFLYSVLCFVEQNILLIDTIEASNLFKNYDEQQDQVGHSQYIGQSGWVVHWNNDEE
jgi:hypothetical protein